MKIIIQRLCLTTFLLTAILIRSLAQAPAIEWQRSFGGSYVDEANCVRQTADGGYIVAGNPSSYAGNGNLEAKNNNGNFDYGIVKINASGVTQWQSVIGGTSNDYAISILQTADGNYVVAGYSSSTDVDVSGNHGSFDFWIVKLNTAGNIIWQKSLGGSSGDFARSIQQTADGGYIVAGYTQSNNGDVSGYHGNTDFWVVKLDASGNKVWTKTLGGTSDEYATCIRQTSDGGYIVAGYTASNDGDVSGLKGNYDYWVVKLNSSGGKIWAKTLGGTQADIGDFIEQTPDGGYLVSGASLSNNGDVSGNHGAYDSWLVKLDTTGGIVWQKSLGGSGDDEARSFYKTSDGGYILAGHSNSNNGDVTGNHGDRDYWIVRINSSGSILWNKSLGGSYFDLANSIQQTSDCGYIIAGFSASSNGDLDTFYIGADYWIVKLAADPTLFKTFYADNDGDGYGNAGSTTLSCSAPVNYVNNSTDCNDANAAIHTGATEVCNGIDDNCNGQIDEGVKSTFYADSDGDGFGTINTTTQACSAPSGYVSNGTDCNDANNAVHPGATEICNGIDDNCDGLIDGADPFITGQPTWFADADGDGFGNATVSTLACNQPPGYVSNNIDCNDANNAVHPGATEVCNGIDDNCNVQIDEGVKSTFYADADSDGFGNMSVTTEACSAPAGYVFNNTDCNDANNAVYPGATETCNGIDDDCDGLTDDADPSISGQPTWYADADADGFGYAASSTLSCNQPSGYVSDNTDCDDVNNGVHPGASEICNSTDDDCDGLTDDADPSISGQPTWYADADGDGSGNAAVSTLDCNQPAGYVPDNTDCNDADNAVHPGAAEICNGTDDNCDGLTDDADPGITGQPTWYADADADGFGNAASSTLSCNQPSGYVSDNTDCDDANNAVHPGATEICNGTDDDCDGLTDDADPSIMGQPIWYADADGDGFGNAASSTLACNQPSGFVSDNTDCSDASNAVHPGATETCNSVDDNCNGQIDEGVQSTFYADADEDGFGNVTVTTQACTAPSGYVSDHTDCNDNNLSVHPGATETCNSIDDNCNGQIDEGVQSTFYADADGDGFGNVTATSQACTAPSGYVSDHTDCNDNNANIHPGATEILNGVDDNCNGQTDEGQCILSVSAGVDENTYFGYTPDQCVVKTAIVTGGAAPFSYSWTLDRPLQNDVITSAGDESMSGINTSSATVCLLDTAVLCVTVTDANGCIATDCVNIFAEDVRCFAGNSGSFKVKVCHSNKTICVAESAVNTHLAHGDYLGKCLSAKDASGSLPVPKLELYPNPTDGKFTLTLQLDSEESAGVVQVIDIIGRIVYEEKIIVTNGEFQQEIQLNCAADGIYSVNVVLNDEVYTKQLVLTKQ